MSCGDAFGPLTDFRIFITWERMAAMPRGTDVRLDRAASLARSDLPAWEIKKTWKFQELGWLYEGSAPSSLVAILAAVAQGHDPEILLDRMEGHRWLSDATTSTLTTRLGADSHPTT